ncbi:hypothetical protein [Myroides sp. WP-1]|uniref:hypothetical protein n=1 Tax=Myroides sp. WP-1 TaxID=2759944 RepID=UPI0015F9DF0A|nr:hypothetical protein [Myroides sp. WP-1]MBB1140155.1 hypothetical protein [Myroides sp. WP-1]
MIEIVLNDIELIGFMRPLNLIKDGVFKVSSLYLTNNYLDMHEKLSLKNLADNGDLSLFNVDNDFYRFYYKVGGDNLEIDITDISSVYYAMIKDIPLVTNESTVKDFALKHSVIVYTPSEALTKISVSKEQIQYLDYILKIV